MAAAPAVRFKLALNWRWIWLLHHLPQSLDVEGTVFPSEEGNFSITVSIGVASMSGPGDSLNDLLRRADRALYESKRAGRNRATVA